MSRCQIAAQFTAQRSIDTFGAKQLRVLDISEISVRRFLGPGDSPQRRRADRECPFRSLQPRVFKAHFNKALPKCVFYCSFGHAPNGSPACTILPLF